MNAAPTLIGLSGWAGSGKDAAAAALVADGWRRLAFADVLRQFALAVDPIVLTADGAPVRLSLLIASEGWDHAKRTHPDVRSLLQRLGTDAGRALLGDSVWVDAAFAKVRPGERVVVTDVRFPSELEAIRSRGGVTVRIDRPGVGPVNGHSSETALDGADFDVHLLNDESLGHLHAAIRRVADYPRARR